MRLVNLFGVPLNALARSHMRSTVTDTYIPHVMDRTDTCH
jgi:hypothetical protein